MSRFVAAVAMAAFVSAQDPGSAIIRPGVAWFDTDNNRMYAGGANLYEEAGTYYLVGEGNKTHEDCSSCFNLYSSPDLATWSECTDARQESTGTRRRGGLVGVTIHGRLVVVPKRCAARLSSSIVGTLRTRDMPTWAAILPPSRDSAVCASRVRVVRRPERVHSASGAAAVQ
jgi:hypothetical protein